MKILKQPRSSRALIKATTITVCLGIGLQTADAQQIHLPPVTRTTWENGVRVILMEYHRAPTLIVTAIFPGGDGADPPEKAGVAALTTTLMHQGTEHRTAPQIAEATDFLGGTFGAVSGDDNITVSMSILSKDADTGLDLLSDIVLHPTFPTEELERERQLELSELQSLAEDPEAVADRMATETIFPGHPYGVDPTITSLKTITRDDLLDYYHHNLIPNHMILVAVGDFKAADMMAKLRARFGDWPRGLETSISVPNANPTVPRRVLIDNPIGTQTQVRFVGTAFPRVSPDFFPAQVASAILGGGFTSRLVDEVRINHSLTYTIGSSFSPRRHGGAFTVTTFTKIETTKDLLDVTRKVLERTADKGFTNAELKKMKGYLAGQFAIAMQTPEALAGQLGVMAFYQLPNDYLQTYLPHLRAVTLAQIDRIARTYFAPDHLSLILVGPAARIQPQINSWSPWEKRSIVSVGK